MQPFTRLTGIATPIDGANIDTDRIIPARFLRKPRGDGYHRYLFHDVRFADDGTEVAGFVLNRAPFRAAPILVADSNFGCGSSREGAVYALADHGIRAIVAPSFGDIFYQNCVKNGLLPVRLPAAVVADWRQRLHERPGATIAIDLPGQSVTGPDGAVRPFDIDAFAKTCLVEGLDDIRLTLLQETEIAAYEERAQAHAPWVFDPRDGTS